MNEIDDIKSKIDIVELVGQYLTLKKAGANYKACCPFHNERSASFMVSPEKQIFHCFGCNAGGDIFEFVMKMDNLTFPEALEILADKAGVQIKKNHQSPAQYQAQKDEKSRLYKINKISAQLFNKILLEHPAGKSALQYLQKRLISLDTIKTFKIGYAPQKKVLGRFLTDRGFSEREIKSAGAPDRFYNRIMFPICDTQGNPVAFTGRALAPDQQPKYLNTAETQIFHKSKILFGLNQAKEFIKTANKSIIVEGQMDVVSSHQAGVKNVAASSGTALTADQLKILSRYNQNICFAFDNDDAGIIACKRAIEIAVAAGLDAKVILIPQEFKDVGEIIERDARQWVKISKLNQPAIDWYFDNVFKNHQTATPQDRKEIAKILLPLVKIIPDSLEQEHYIKILSRQLNTPQRIIFESLQRVKTNVFLLDQENAVKIDNQPISTEENLTALLLKYPQHLSLVMTNLNYTDFKNDILAQKIYKFLQSCYTSKVCKKDTQCNISGEVLKCLGKKLSNEEFSKANFLILEIEKRTENAKQDDIIADIKQSAARIKQDKAELVKYEFAQKISAAEELGDRNKLKELLRDLQNAIK